MDQENNMVSNLTACNSVHRQRTKRLHESQREQIFRVEPVVNRNKILSYPSQLRSNETADWIQILKAEKKMKKLVKSNQVASARKCPSLLRNGSKNPLMTGKCETCFYIQKQKLCFCSAEDTCQHLPLQDRQEMLLVHEHHSSQGNLLLPKNETFLVDPKEESSCLRNIVESEEENLCQKDITQGMACQEVGRKKAGRPQEESSCQKDIVQVQNSFLHQAGTPLQEKLLKEIFSVDRPEQDRCKQLRHPINCNATNEYVTNKQLSKSSELKGSDILNDKFINSSNLEQLSTLPSSESIYTPNSSLLVQTPEVLYIFQVKSEHDLSEDEVRNSDETSLKTERNHSVVAAVNHEDVLRVEEEKYFFDNDVHHWRNAPNINLLSPKREVFDISSEEENKSEEKVIKHTHHGGNAHSMNLLSLKREVFDIGSEEENKSEEKPAEDIHHWGNAHSMNLLSPKREVIDISSEEDNKGEKKTAEDTHHGVNAHSMYLLSPKKEVIDISSEEENKNEKKTAEDVSHSWRTVPKENLLLSNRNIFNIKSEEKSMCEKKDAECRNSLICGNEVTGAVSCHYNKELLSPMIEAVQISSPEEKGATETKVETVIEEKDIYNIDIKYHNTVVSVNTGTISLEFLKTLSKAVSVFKLSSSRASKNKRLLLIGSAILPCPVCNLQFKYAKTLTLHFLNSHKDVDLPKFLKSSEKEKYSTTSSNYKVEASHGAPENILNNIDGWYKCDQCKSTFRSKRPYIFHLRRTHNLKQLCPVCGIFTEDPSTFKIHLEKHKCPVCGKTYTRGVSLERHICNIDICNIYVKQTHKCPRCDIKCTSALSLRNHFRLVHEGSCPYACRICGLQFTRMDHLIRHLKHHFFSKRKRSYTSATTNGSSQHDFDAPIWSHTSPKCYPPQKGQKQQSPSWKLTDRTAVFGRRSQTGLVCCKYGQQECQGIGSLKRHLLTHIKSSRHKCKICHMTFATALGVKRHARKHDNPQFELSYTRCLHRTETIDELRKHVETHRATYNCQTCGVTFSRKYMLSDHEFVKHKQPVEQLLLSKTASRRTYPPASQRKLGFPLDIVRQ